MLLPLPSLPLGKRFAPAKHDAPCYTSTKLQQQKVVLLLMLWREDELHNGAKGF